MHVQTTGLLYAFEQGHLAPCGPAVMGHIKKLLELALTIQQCHTACNMMIWSGKHNLTNKLGQVRQTPSISTLK